MINVPDNLLNVPKHKLEIKNVKGRIKVVQLNHNSTFEAAISRNKNLTPGRLLKHNNKGKLICAKSRKEAKFIFIQYVPRHELTAVVRFY